MPDQFLNIGSSNIRVEQDGGFITLDHNHEKIHLGQMFYFDHYGTVANGGTLNWLITCGPVYNLHAALNIDVNGAFQVYLYDNSAGSAGTAIPLWNLNRDSTGTISATVAHTPTISDAGSAIVNGHYIPAGAGVNGRVGGGLRADSEIILDAGKKYLYRAVNISGAAGTVTFSGQVYEEESE
jgi:hypothetical protein